MESLREIYRIGPGPSSSHTIGPRLAAERFLRMCPNAARYKVTLYGSLAATGRGHRTDQAISEALAPSAVEIIWKPEEILPYHPNGMVFVAYNTAGSLCRAPWRVYSIGGGAIREEGEPAAAESKTARISLTDVISWTEETGQTIWEYVFARQEAEIPGYLSQVWLTMCRAIDRGVEAQGVLPGPLRLSRRAASYYARAQWCSAELRRTGLLAAYALAVAEENASGGTIVTAPTCGSCGIVPAVLRYLQQSRSLAAEQIVQALATAGLIGYLVKKNASISGAEVGCQGEVGTACAMAAAAATQLLGGTPRQIEHAAEMGIEHHIGLTCDPVAGFVQIPCIERNAFAATRAMDCATLAILADGTHRVGFDHAVRAMWQTGRDLSARYRETSQGGLALNYQQR